MMKTCRESLPVHDDIDMIMMLTLAFRRVPYLIPAAGILIKGKVSRKWKYEYPWIEYPVLSG